MKKNNNLRQEIRGQLSHSFNAPDKQQLRIIRGTTTTKNIIEINFSPEIANIIQLNPFDSNYLQRWMQEIWFLTRQTYEKES